MKSRPRPNFLQSILEFMEVKNNNYCQSLMLPTPQNKNLRNEN